jgi:hypothetical protein
MRLNDLAIAIEIEVRELGRYRDLGPLATCNAWLDHINALKLMRVEAVERHPQPEVVLVGRVCKAMEYLSKRQRKAAISHRQNTIAPLYSCQRSS